MELKRYQERVLREIRTYLDALAAEQAKGNRYASLEAWRIATKRATPNPQRFDGIGEDLPHFCVRVPTGGGKTLLATQVLGEIHSTILRARNGTGLALWIVSSDQIYKDTLKRLRDRRDPYRERLEFALRGRVEVWEKHEVARITPVQMSSALNVLLFKLPSANRQTKDELKMFRDCGGNIVQHFPPEDDAAAQRKLKAEVPNLDMITDDLARTSLANLIRLARPAVILDEGHKAYSDLAQRTLEGFNVSIVVELSATPDPRKSNVLTRVSGRELLDEEMIKLPINVSTSGEGSWERVLGLAKMRRDDLAARARAAPMDGREIRPIVLVQVERTGAAQRDSAFVHAEAVKEHLMQKLGVPEYEIAIKSSEKDDIEGIDLLDEGCRITWIITKSALQEGWDCPFAYVLVSLANATSKTALSQIVGRVLRQPFARKTGVPELDESYVFCLRKSSSEILKEVKKALEDEGYEGEGSSVVDASGERPAVARRRAFMREELRAHYRRFDGKVYLPRFCVRTETGYESLDYFGHLVRSVDVDSFDFARIQWDLDDVRRRARETYLRIELDVDDAQTVDQREILSLESDSQVSAWLVANLDFGFLGHRALRRVVERVVGRVLRVTPSLASNLGSVRFEVLERLRGFIQSEVDKQTQHAFQELFREGDLRFYLECVQCRFDLPPEIELRSTRALVHADNAPIERSLFDYVPEESVNGYEREIALYLDRHDEVLWWFRNEVGAQHFSIQGYRRGRVYPDFVVQRGRREPKSGWKPMPSVLVVESKGEHLLGNDDSNYKRDLASRFEELGRAVTWQDLGAGFAESTFRFQVLEGDQHGAWRDALAAALQGQR